LWSDVCDLDTREKARRRLQLILQSILLRRTKDQTYNGRPILQLPPKTVTLRTTAFSADERILYDDLFNKAKNTFNKYARDGTVLNNYMKVLELLLRLRQACDHPALALKGKGDHLHHTFPLFALRSLLCFVLS
jgi:SNF2 family DNA or RNA helicase